MQNVDRLFAVADALLLLGIRLTKFADGLRMTFTGRDRPHHAHHHHGAGKLIDARGPVREIWHHHHDERSMLAFCAIMSYGKSS